MKPLSGRPLAVVSALYLLLYVLLHAAARVFEVSPGISLWYPPVGLTLAFVTLYGWRSSPAVILGGVYVALIGSSGSAHWAQGAISLLIAVTYLGSGLLVHRWFGPLPAPTSAARTSLLVALYFTAPTVASLLGSAVAYHVGFIPPDHLRLAFFHWWMGDLTGVLTILPLLLVHGVPRLVGAPPSGLHQWSWPQRLEVLLQAFALVGSVGLVHGLTALRDYHAYYLCFIPLVWICLRHGLPGATLATCTLTMGSMAALRLFGSSPHLIVDVLLFEIAVAAVGLGLGSAVTRRNRAETERARLLEILESSPDFIASANLDGRVLYLNAAMRRLRQLAPETLSGHTLPEFHPAPAADRILRESIPTALKQGSWQGESVLTALDGREIPVSQLIITHYDESGRPIMLSTVARDITAQRQEEQARLEGERHLLQTQKLESLGVLAGGIAHDFNNLLTAMLGNASLARLDVAEGSPPDAALAQIEQAALRAAELCRQMLAYSGRHQLAAGPVDLSALIQDNAHLLEVSKPKKSTLTLDLAPDLPAVTGDSTQLSQIVINLVLNAAEAVRDKAGHIAVRTAAVELDRAALTAGYVAPQFAPGRHVLLEVQDNGTGMSPEIQARIFEPFFTTKSQGHGLGLSAVLGIARSHRGAIQVSSAPDHGTIIRLYLPTSDRRAPVRPVPKDSTSPWNASGRVLVVDDEDAVRLITRHLLERTGFHVTTARHGREALDLLLREPAAYRAILLDVMMPVLDGEETLRELRKFNADVPVIMMSGYNAKTTGGRFAGERIAGFLAKPFEATHLTQALRKALDD